MQERLAVLQTCKPQRVSKFYGSTFFFSLQRCVGGDAEVVGSVCELVGGSGFISIFCFVVLIFVHSG